MSALDFARMVLPRRGMTAFGLAVLWLRPELCTECRNRRAMGACLHPSGARVAAMAEALDAMVANREATRVDGDRLGNGGASSTIWYPT